MKISYSIFIPFPELQKDLSVQSDLTEVSGNRVKQIEVSRFTVESHKDRSVTVSFAGSALVTMNCGRCLRSVDVSVSFETKRTLDPDKQIDEDGYPVSCFTEEGLDADELIREEISLKLPVRILCREDCKGLCPVCGSDLNAGSCGCEEKAVPTRMAELLQAAMKDRDSSK